MSICKIESHRALTLDPNPFVDGPGYPVLRPTLVRVSAQRLRLKVARQKVLCPLGYPDDEAFFAPTLGKLRLEHVVRRAEGREGRNESGVRRCMIGREAVRTKTGISLSMGQRSVRRRGVPSEEVVSCVPLPVDHQVDVGMDEEGEQERDEGRSMDVERLRNKVTRPSAANEVEREPRCLDGRY